MIETPSLVSFHGDPAVKQHYLARIAAHEAADEIIHGVYWEGGRGCAVGCTLHSDDHAAYETELGIPAWLAHLEDGLFETMDRASAKTFPRRFLEAIPVGVDLEPVKWHFCAFVLRGNIERVLTLDIDEALKTQVVDAIRQVLAVHEGAIASGIWDESAAAWAWAESAWSESAWAAWAWAESAWSESAAWAAWAAAESAWSESAAWAAAESAWAAARASHATVMADALVQMLAATGDAEMVA